MSHLYLLDTNVVSEPLRSKPSPSILRRLRRHEEEMAIPAIVWHELRFGWQRLAPGRRRDAIGRYLDEVVAVAFPILEYDRAAAEWHAFERVRLTAAGRTPPYIDGQIAAIARVRDLTLVTSNVEDFRMYEGLRVEDWSRA